MNTIPELIEDIRNGKMVILVDDEGRENEGDLVLAADFVTPEAINFMASEAKGLICLSLTAEQAKKLELPLMVHEDGNLSPNKTAFTVSIEAAQGVTTGISAADRAHTIRVASNPKASRKDIIMPGHIFPIRAHSGGVLKRAGHTEASVDLSVLSGLNPAAAICEIMNSDGTMARVPQLKAFANKHGIKIGTIEDLINYRIENESFVRLRAESTLPSQYGEGFKVHVFENLLDGNEHIAISKGIIDPEQPTLVRVHTECILGDLFGSLRTKSGDYLNAALKKINEEGTGLLVYLKMEGTGSRLINRVKTYSRIDNGEPTTDELREIFHSDKKDYGVGAQILRALGARKLRLMTNRHSKRVGLKGYGLEIVEEVHLPVETDPLLNPFNKQQEVSP